MTELSVELSEEDFLCVGRMLKTYERNHGKQERVELAKHIVERAKDPENYLHKYFDWADKKQRRVLANSIVLKLRARTIKRPAKPVLVEKIEGPSPVYTMPMPDLRVCRIVQTLQPPFLRPDDWYGRTQTGSPVRVCPLPLERRFPVSYKRTRDLSLSWSGNT